MKFCLTVFTAIVLARRHALHALEFAALFLIVLTLPAAIVSAVPLSTDEPAPENYSGPITISEGGTYTGNWRSTSDGTPAVYVATTQPVTIEFSHLTGPGNLLHVTWHGNVT